MPVYEYSCARCHLKFELMRALSRSDEAALCPQCGGGAERVLSSFACVSKGADGGSASLGGSGCGTCSATSCGSCQ